MSDVAFDVDLDAFAANLRAIRERVAPAEHMLVVKDDAYRHGLEAIVRRAVAEGITWIGALDVVTGAAARAVAGDSARIFAWLVDGADDIAEAVDAHLDIGVGTEALLEGVAAGAAAAETTALVHLKIDTGLHRNGVRPERWQAFVARASELEQAGSIRVMGIWTHIAEASDDDDDAQRAVYDAAVAQAREAGLAPEFFHVAASAAAFARPEFRYNMVRIGAFAYGIRSADGPSESELGLRVVGALRSRVLRVARAGISVAGGYTAGLPSTAAGSLSVQTPAGRSELTAVRADTSSLAPWPEAAVGDEITLWGGTGESATALGERLGTIGEEIVLRLSREVPRRYLG